MNAITYTIARHRGQRIVRRTIGAAPLMKVETKQPRWPVIISAAPELAAKASLCDACENVGAIGCGRPYCKLIGGSPNADRLYNLIVSGHPCPAGRFAGG